MKGLPPGPPTLRLRWGFLSRARRRSATAPPSADAGTPVAARPALRVLLVDDEPANLLLIAARMEALGFKALQATDGAEAVAMACERPFDLILMDLQMPILDGLRATAAIRRFEKHLQRPAAPVVAHSGNPPAADVLARFGLSDRLAKPCSDQELKDCLARWCPGHALLRAA